MFMDPSAFEADDIERELRDAGLEPEADPATTARDDERREDPLLHPGKRNDASPSCGSSYGLSSAGAPDGEKDTKRCTICDAKRGMRRVGPRC